MLNSVFSPRRVIRHVWITFKYNIQQNFNSFKWFYRETQVSQWPFLIENLLEGHLLYENKINISIFKREIVKHDGH